MTTLKKIPLTLWLFVFSLAVFVTSLARLPEVDAEYTEADYQRYSRDNVKLRKAIVLYHKDMNQFFNEKLKVLLSKSPGDKAVIPPLANETCDPENVSTYCVALLAVDKYEAFRRAVLITHSPYIFDPADSDEVVYFTTEEASKNLAVRKDLIDEQLELAENTLDATLATYNEVYLFYSLHKEYWNLIKDVEKFRDQLSKVRSEVEHYPYQFIDRTTTECT